MPLLVIDILINFFYPNTGKTIDGQGHYVGGVQLALIDQATNVQKSFVTSSINDGSYNASIPEGTYRIQANPFNQSGAYLSKTVSDVVVSGTTSLDITLDPAPGSVTLSGKLVTPQNQPINGATVSFSSPGANGAFYKTTAQGEYFFRLLPRSDYQITAAWDRGNPPRIAIPSSARVVIPTYALTQDTVQDMIMPTVTAQVHVQNPNGTPAQTATVDTVIQQTSTITVNSFGTANVFFSDTTSTNANGDASLYFFSLPTVSSDTPILEAIPPGNSQFFDTRIVGVAVPSDTSFTMTLSTLPTVSGTIHDAITGTRLPNQTIEVSKDTAVVSSLLTNSLTPFNFYTKVPVGSDYTFKAHSNGKLPTAPTSYELSGTFSLATSKEVVIPLPDQYVGIQVKDADTGGLVPAHVSATGSAIALSINSAGLNNITGFSRDAIHTDTNGSARLILFNTNGSATNSGYTITAVPDDTSYLPNSITNVLVTGNMEATIYVSHALSAVSAINAGGDLQDTYVADTNFSGGSQYTSSNTVDTSGITNAAPQGVYKSVRYGNFTYTIPNLTPNTNYTVRLHFNELYWGTANSGNQGGVGSRVFNVSINGAQVLSNFDIFQVAGGGNKAIVEDFIKQTNSLGKMTITFTTVTDNAMVNGIELFQ